ncbi:hypothetical protein G7062_06440 [Erysipelothrix sp. HDW6C]|uniref:hypothetical protein n=1 Tax=Erysipelothrix sp. HDW6C TaxID=2714930 RepID=UPI001408C2BB|nr:hypothetical protein [Erysipelothrix sp. HDW6C]QIK69946.1 hypothetical protein G7062_06440 [Erysipelothrix sp. HDW6C]
MKRRDEYRKFKIVALLAFLGGCVLGFMYKNWEMGLFIGSQFAVIGIGIASMIQK